MMLSHTTALLPLQAIGDEKAAKAGIERDGDNGVRVLSGGTGGVRRARACRARPEIAVSVDSARNVSAD